MLLSELLMSEHVLEKFHVQAQRRKKVKKRDFVHITLGPAVSGPHSAPNCIHLASTLENEFSGLLFDS